MAAVTRTTTWSSGDTLTASALNGEFNNLLNALAIVNADVSGSAGIVFSKLDSATVAGVSATQTFTNKTLTNPLLTGHRVTVTSDTDGATITFDLDTGAFHQVTLAGNRTLAVSNSAVGKVFFIRLLQDGSGSRTVTWFSTITWTGAAAPTLTITANRADLFAFVTRASGTYDGMIVGQNIA